MESPQKLSLPLIDVGPLLSGAPSSLSVSSCANEIDSACRDSGFFRITNHGVSADLRQRLDKLSREFFALGETEKQKCAMPLAGSAWRGWFGVGDELTSGVPDRKEGLYIGQQLPANDPRVIAQNPFAWCKFVPAITRRVGCVCRRMVCGDAESRRCFNARCCFGFADASRLVCTNYCA